MVLQLRSAADPSLIVDAAALWDQPEHTLTDCRTGASGRLAGWPAGRPRINGQQHGQGIRHRDQIRGLASIDSTPREVMTVSAVSIRNLDDRVKERLRLRAARHGRSMEAEMRVILTEAVREAGDEESLVTALMDRFAELGGVELEIPARTARPRAAELG